MKKLCLLLFVAALCSCKKASVDNQNPITIVAKWVKNKTVSTETINGSPTPTTETLFSDPNNYIQFNSDGTGVISAGSNGNYILTNFTYSLDGSTLIIPHNFYPATTTETQTFTLTASSLVIHSDELIHNTGDIPYEYVTDDYYNK